jgi:hypothetical protein
MQVEGSEPEIGNATEDVETEEEEIIPPAKVEVGKEVEDALDELMMDMENEGEERDPILTPTTNQSPGEDKTGDIHTEPEREVEATEANPDPEKESEGKPGPNVESKPDTETNSETGEGVESETELSTPRDDKQSETTQGVEGGEGSDNPEKKKTAVTPRGFSAQAARNSWSVVKRRKEDTDAPIPARGSMFMRGRTLTPREIAIDPEAETKEPESPKEVKIEISTEPTPRESKMLREKGEGARLRSVANISRREEHSKEHSSEHSDNPDRTSKNSENPENPSDSNDSGIYVTPLPSFYPSHPAAQQLSDCGPFVLILFRNTTHESTNATFLKEAHGYSTKNCGFRVFQKEVREYGGEICF